ATRAAVPWEAAARYVPLLGSELKLGAECAIALLGYAVRPAASGPVAERRQAVGSAAVMVVSAAAYVAGGARPVGPELVAGPDGRLLLTLFNTLFTAHSCWCVAVFGLAILRSSGEVAPGLPRTGLRLIAVGTACGLAWSALSAVPLWETLTTGRQEIEEDAASAPVALGTLLFGIGGMTLAVWAAFLTRTAQRVRAWRDHRRLQPLWSALHSAVPEISLTAEAGVLGLGGVLRNPEFALYRRVIEIRDGQLTLRAHADPRVAGWAAEASAGDAAVVEAAVLAAALESAAAGHRPAVDGAGYSPGELAPDLAAETAWLVTVSRAFARSAVVAQVRRRVREHEPIPHQLS
ncbi:MAB_1171c family putative transporter, partial [Kitasatospora sp. NPDC093558]|uniref:MAB_1171c family putative transporter n=1 Tax=Kitasatospora sp. NPDC093558 TaxID=3155201 RepID=UPI003423711B